MKLYTRQELNDLDEDEIIKLLKKSWHINEDEKIEVYGKFQSRKINFTSTLKINITNIYYSLIEVKTLSHHQIEYPLAENIKPLKDRGIYIPPYIGKELSKQLKYNEELYIRCVLQLADANERKKYNNPLLLSVNIDSIKEYKKIKKIVFIESDDYLLIEKNIVENYIIENQDILDKKIKVLENSFEKEKKNIDNKIIDIEDELKEKQNIFDKKIKILQKKENSKLKKIYRLEENRIMLTNDIKNKTTIIETLNTEITELGAILENEEDTMGKKLEKLRSFIKDKANKLLNLEFIDKEEYNNLLMISKEDTSNEVFIDFKNDYFLDKQSAISHIQAYLFEKDIVYPRYILEDFFALIQTNDLIILAGESGSGKTNLIKSFADAIGGKFFIIPVKPNWTSSEDLLGYYNPLEKKYLTTPFLEALLEAKDNPDTPYFICLDEMNLARVEYYFADFLSLLEERGEQPEIKLYSEDESAHILSEFKNVMKTIEIVKEKYKKKNIVNFIELLQDEEINKELTRIFGFSDKDSLIKYHTDLRRMLTGILNTPSSITFPKNVRIIGAINIDETTHYLSPKILDRAHIMKFDSPLLQDWTKIENEIEDVKNKELRLKFEIEDLGEREAYPSYDREDKFCKIITDMTKKYFSPLGIEVGLRTIRQGLNYQKIFREQGSDEELVLNNFILHKILPKMTFDGNKKIDDKDKKELLEELKANLKEYINQEQVEDKSIDAISELEHIIKVSDSNDGIVNYWA